MITFRGDGKFSIMLFGSRWGICRRKKIFLLLSFVLVEAIIGMPLMLDVIKQQITKHMMIQILGVIDDKMTE